VVLETLTPEQRVAFVLHDVFAVPFDEIAAMLGVSGAAARQLATRARRAVAEGRPRHTATLAEQRQVADAFLAAVSGGDLDALLALLAPDVIAVGDGGGVVSAGLRAVEGSDKVARFVFGIFEKTARTGSMRAEPVLVNGSLGFLLEFGEPPQRLVSTFAIADGRITALFDQLNPAKLTRVPAVDPARDVLARP
jgi:RNA polymerase sigma-70 factor (ECF subfamily)